MSEISSQEFINKLNEVQELMLKEDYKRAIIILDKLKVIDKQNDYNYNLSHKLYQLDSNVHSLYNQQIILQLIFNLSREKKEIFFTELQELLKTEESLDIDIGTLKREIEILVLRSLLTCTIEDNRIQL
ncbi:MAG: hypothetical protein P8Y23_11480 [Candidatus Lokiarchaeota archaeon]|jgi:hypothetical protein